MGFTDAIKICFKKYATFSGRATRSEYWWFALFLILGSTIIGLVSNALSTLFWLATLIPGLAAGWRRMHDSGRPGWYILLPTLVAIGLMSFFVGGFMIFDQMGPMGGRQAGRDAGEMIGVAWVLLSGLIMIVLWGLLIYWLTRPSDPDANEYGPPTVKAD